MTTEQALLRAILDQPDDDTARLVYADYLDDTPTPKRQARAEFIRLQVARADRGEAEMSPQESALMKKWGLAWLPRFIREESSITPDLWGIATSPTIVLTVSGTEGKYHFDRGFLKAINFTAAAPPHPERMAAFARAVLSAHPLDTLGIVQQGRVPHVRVTFHHGVNGWTATCSEVWHPNSPGANYYRPPCESRREFLREVRDFLVHRFRLLWNRLRTV